MASPRQVGGDVHEELVAFVRGEKHCARLSFVVGSRVTARCEERRQRDVTHLSPVGHVRVNKG
jgi:hypothetical protein